MVQRVAMFYHIQCLHERLQGKVGCVERERTRDVEGAVAEHLEAHRPEIIFI